MQPELQLSSVNSIQCMWMQTTTGGRPLKRGCNLMPQPVQMACEPRAQLSGQLTQAFLLRWSLSPLVGYSGPA